MPNKTSRNCVISRRKGGSFSIVPSKSVAPRTRTTGSVEVACFEYLARMMAASALARPASLLFWKNQELM